MISNIDNIIEFIKGSNDFVVTSHISPDGDNIGSTLGIYYSLKKLGIKYKISCKKIVFNMLCISV